MRISFKINYNTLFGESVCVVIKDDIPTIIPLSTCDGRVWYGSYDSTNERIIEYNYAIYRGEELVRREMLVIPHTIEIDPSISQSYVVEDIWRDLPNDNYRYSTAFSGVQCRIKNDITPAKRHFTLRVLSPALAREEMQLGVVGGTESLGLWGASSVVLLDEISPNLWSITLPITSGEEYIEYKFVAVDKATKSIVKWEDGNNRGIWLGGVADGENYYVAESEVVLSDSQVRIAGSAIPIFSLRSEEGCGVGDFGDLKKYITWAAATKQQAVQILPINDTTISNTWRDSYPYNSISIYAFNPMYVDLRGVSKLKSNAAMKRYEEQRLKLNNLAEVDYVGVNELKRGYLHKLFLQEGMDVIQSPEFESFFEKNSHWLQPYAAFSYMRDKEGSANFNEWSEYSIYNKDEISTLCSPKSKCYDQIALYYYIQYLLHVQLLEAADLARELGVILKGDIPIGISRESVEAWVEPHYFNMNGQAGAPPDAFSANGQNWGFPTYNWDVMERDNYLWWRRRFAKMSEYFTAYRIDHILGFFRIWEIPTHSVHGLLGQFAPALPMSAGEIESWGLHFQPEFMTEPFINEEMLNDIFGCNTNIIKQVFVQHKHHDIYEMRDKFKTQRQIEEHFKSLHDDFSLGFKEGLYRLVSNVLFVKDRHNPDMYHPRISAQSDYLFGRLNTEEQSAFNRLYNHYFYERHNEFWYHEAMKKLPVLTGSTSMLVCGEDLGMVPDCVPPVMRELQIVSLEIERMPKDPRETFGRPANYPFTSVCTIGTHDMSTFRGWWLEDQQQSQRYYYDELGMGGEVPEDATDWLCREVVVRHLDSPSMLAIITWQDWIALYESHRNPDIEIERINIPANPRHYWRWRMHISLEELLCNEEINSGISNLITASGR